MVKRCTVYGTRHSPCSEYFCRTPYIVAVGTIFNILMQCFDTITYPTTSDVLRVEPYIRCIPCSCIFLCGQKSSQAITSTLFLQVGIKFTYQNMDYWTGREGTMGCLLQKSPKFYNNVFLFVFLLGTFMNFD